VVYASPLNHTSGPLQAILGQTIIPFTLLVTPRVMERTYERNQIFGAVIVLFGAFYAMIPLFKHYHDGDAQTENGEWWWPLIFVLGQLPAALMNIIQEKTQKDFHQETKARFSVIYFQFGESFYQLLSFSCLFWFDLLPNYGNADGNLSNFNELFKLGFQCFFGAESAVQMPGGDRCSGYCGGLGILFICFYVMNYLFCTELTNYDSANYASIMSGLSPVLVMTFWYAFPSVNEWGQGTPYSLGSLDGIFNITALPIVIIGIILYKKFDKHNSLPNADEQRQGPIELCFQCPSSANEYTAMHN